jgi:hypothetical protein
MGETDVLPAPTRTFSLRGSQGPPLPKTSRNKRIGPFTLARQEILEALKFQKSCVAVAVEDKSSPRMETTRPRHGSAADGRMMARLRPAGLTRARPDLLTI